MKNNEGHPGDVIRKFAEARVKHKFPTKDVLVVVISLCLSNLPNLLQLCKHSQQYCYQTTSSFFFFFFFFFFTSFLALQAQASGMRLANNRSTIILRSICYIYRCNAEISWVGGGGGGEITL